MAYSPVTKSYYQYVSDDNVTYRVRLADYIATQLNSTPASKIGAVAAVGTEPKLPGGHQMRRAVVRNLVTKVDRVVVIPKPDAPIITVPRGATASDYTLLLNEGAAAGNQGTYTYQGLFLTETRGRRA